jgi:hypothetical protein
MPGHNRETVVNTAVAEGELFLIAAGQAQHHPVV